MFLKHTLVLVLVTMGICSNIPSTLADDGTVKYQDEIIDLKAVMDTCNETFALEYNYWESLNDSGTFPDETDKMKKCFIRCMLEGTGVASIGGASSTVYDAGRATALFAGNRNQKEKDDIEVMAKACSDNRMETCKCERGYAYLKCFFESIIEKYVPDEGSN